MRKYLLATVAAVGFTAAPAMAADFGEANRAFDWSGFYVGLHAGYFSGDAVVTEGGITPGGSVNGFIGGPLAGYNFPAHNGPFLFGVEADFGLSGAVGHGLQQQDAVLDLYNYDLHWNAHVRARAGVPMGGFMPFVAGGLAVADFDVTEATIFGGVYTGWTIGAGVDARLSDRVIGRAEVLYDDYGSKQYDTFTASLTGWTGRVALIVKLGP